MNHGKKQNTEGAMKGFIGFLLCFCFLSFVRAHPLSVTDDGRYLSEEGKAFFWLGDTAWELFHRLSRNEIVTYLNDRAEKNYNVIQAVVLYELQAFETPNAHGDFPLINESIAQPDTTAGHDPDDAVEYDYWDHVEYMLQQTAERGMYAALLPCWGEYVTPRFRERSIKTTEQGYEYGRFIGSRYRHYNDHIIWMLGGDRLPDERKNGVEIWRAMAEGITDGVNGETGMDGNADYTTTFMTYHCFRTSSLWFHGDAWIDMHTWGSYHAEHNNERAIFVPLKDFRLPDRKPTLNSEPCYENLPIAYDWKEAAQGYFDDFDVRQIAYWSVFSGACGHTYGCHSVWQMYKKQNPHPPLTTTVKNEWQAGLDAPGSTHMSYLKQLILSKPFFSRKPDWEILIENVYDPPGRFVACSGDGYAMIYIPTGKPVRVNSKVIADRVQVSWMNPRTGEIKNAGEQPAGSDQSFDPSGETQRGNDWVLILDASE